ncbi:hypothetical protein TERTU_4147 [Teredinibacter turnerae T7901]|uniref:Uncharacterized protein n=1 Tax=Teredinibacter turnerae (strain ATCC 39867 / T7901) TaxID=377629 RepID=C5BUJ2_TERTT|nr:AHH domain-containing protein [Teredinibacter turnerae]ACR11742.1 hypothetical protein TERTU_4147 [Teredinibacter turnerae T7901]
MKLEYRNGVRITQFDHELSPLEAAMRRFQENIDEQQQLANEHYDNSVDPKKEEARKSALAYLAMERQQLATLAGLYEQLEEYRKLESKVVSKDKKTAIHARDVMLTEEHHPTDDLEMYMRAEGVPKPSSQHTAHHICPGSGRWEKNLIRNTRIHMHSHGVRINDPANGVYLLHKDDYTPHYSMPNSRGHLTYHTREYEKLVAGRISTLPSRDVIKTQLQVIGRLLQQNEPKGAFAKMRALRS